MEIVRATDTSVKIKTKDLTFVVDPGEKYEGDVILITTPDADVTQYKDLVVFYGPGEFEVSGVSIKCEKMGGGLVYELSQDSKKVLVGTTDSIADIKETEGYSAIVIFAKTKIDEGMLSGFTSELVVVYGESENVGLPAEVIKKIDKVNLKKIEDLKGFVVYLTK